jgi:hypothetical protein
MTDLKPCPFCGGEALPYQGCKMADPDRYYIQCQRCPASTDASCDIRLAERAWNTRPSPWCSVADRLPEVGIEGYLTHGGECIEPWRVCFMDKTGWRVLDDFEDSAPGVTHWMPLPLPPEEKQ